MVQQHKILFVGDLNEYARIKVRADLLQEMGHQVIPLTHTRVESRDVDYHRWSFIEKVAWKLGFQLDNQDANRKIKKIVQSEHPDTLWIDKGNMIYSWTLSFLKKHYPRMVIASTTEDDMFAWHNRTWFYTWGLKYYDIVFTTKSYNLNPEELPALGARRVVMVYQGYNPKMIYPITLSEADRLRYGAEVSFVGNYEYERAESMYYLASHGVSVRVWGSGWNECSFHHPLLHLELKPAFNDDRELGYTKAICATKINLCFLRKINRDLHTSRSIEIPACGAFMLAERTTEHQALFTEDKEAVYFDNNEELLEKTKYYLTHENERQQIAQAGYERCLRDHHTQRDRLEYMLSCIEGCFQ